LHLPPKGEGRNCDLEVSRKQGNKTLPKDRHRYLVSKTSKKGELMFNSFMKSFWQEEDGQDLVEYSLLMAFIALAAVGVLGTVKNSISTIWTSVNTQLSSVAAS
jgi:Flp pilus assembly pilin Flp